MFPGVGGSLYTVQRVYKRTDYSRFETGSFFIFFFYQLVLPRVCPPSPTIDLLSGLGIPTVVVFPLLSNQYRNDV